MDNKENENASMASTENLWKKVSFHCVKIYKNYPKFLEQPQLNFSVTTELIPLTLTHTSSSFLGAWRDKKWAVTQSMEVADG